MGAVESSCCQQGHDNGHVALVEGLGDDELQDLETEPQPQVLTSEVVSGLAESVEVWPEEWGLTLDQVRDLIVACREDESWSEEVTMRELVADFVVPLTQGKGVGYALLVNCKQPRQVNVLVSNCWLESAEGLLQALEGSVSCTDVLFICGFAMYQCEDGAGPSLLQQMGTDEEMSPFARVMRHIKRRGSGSLCECCWWRQASVAKLPALLLLPGLSCLALPVLALGCVPSSGKCAVGTLRAFSAWHSPVSWNWSNGPLEPWAAAVTLAGHVVVLLAAASWACLAVWPPYGGRMLVVPNHSCDVYSHEDPTDCCGGHKFEKELGVCMVKLELFAARDGGCPVQLASPWPRSGQARRRLTPRACETKRETTFDDTAFEDSATEVTALSPETTSSRRKSVSLKGVVVRPSAAADRDVEDPKRTRDACGVDEDRRRVDHKRYDEINGEVQRTMEEVWHEAALIDSIWAASVAVASACGVRLAYGQRQASVGVCFTLGLLLGGAAACCAAAAAARRPAAAVPLWGCRLVPGAGWGCTAAALAAGSGISGLLFVNGVGHLRYFLAGAAASLMLGAIVVASLVFCLYDAPAAAGGLYGALALGAALPLVFVRHQEVYPTAVATGSLAFGLLLGPLAGSWCSASRWGLGVSLPFPCSGQRWATRALGAMDATKAI